MAVNSKALFQTHLESMKPWMSEEEFEAIREDRQCLAAFTAAYTQQPQPILNHCSRTYIYASRTAQKSFPTWKCAFHAYTAMPSWKSMYVACMLHDIAAVCHDGPERFEVEGADMAVDLMKKDNPSTPDFELKSVWEAIALHTSPGIAERISPLALALRIAVKIDFARQSVYEDDKQALELYCKEVESVFERANIEKVLGDAVAEGAVKNPKKAPNVSWPYVLMQAKLANPNYEGANPGF
jgi:HD superfamily phosphodiesterase